MRSDYCGSINRAHLQQTVTVFGWVHRRRDHGGVIFIDLRDRAGLLQVVCDPDYPATFKTAETLRNEFVVRVTGKVRPRPEGTVNANLVSGEIEVLADEIEILNPSLTPPFMMDDDQISENIRLEYRFLDLRRFFYALPQSPQLFKQLLMVSGFDRYYQIVKCFRDEDLRADRQPEFTQIDIETSFLNEREIQDIMEGLVRHMFKQTLDVELGAFPRIAYAEAMARYGSDKPDLRVKLELTDLTDLMKTVDFKVFKQAASLKDGRVAAMRVPGGAALSRKEIDHYTTFVAIYGAKGLAYIKVNDVSKLNDEGLQSPIVKFMTPEILGEILRRTGAANGDLIFFGADRAKVVNDALGALRVKVGHEKGHAEAGWRPVWVVDFPAFDYDEEAKRWNASHHPFTSPKDEHVEFLTTDPGRVQAKAYDVALNGWEIGGGSVRIHRAEVQAKIFEVLGITPEDARAKFGFLLDALQYGAPPHGGIAFGLDRLVTLMVGADSIREVIAFPKTQRGQDLMVNAPSAVTEPQLRELHIRLRRQEPTV